MSDPIGSHEIPIDDILKTAYDKLKKAYIMGEAPNAIHRTSFPIVSELASPGSGKTFSIQTLAADQKILESWWEGKKEKLSKKLSQSTWVEKLQLSNDFYEKMKNALRIVITYNSFSDFDGFFDEEELAEIGMCCRILYRFVLMVIYLNSFDEKQYSCYVKHPRNLKESWGQFQALISQLLEERKVSLSDVLNFIWKISNNRPILLLVDEIGRAEHQILVPILSSLREGYHDKFFTFYSALNPEYLTVDGKTISTRAIFFVPLYRRNFKDVMWLFDNLIRQKGQQLGDNDRRLVERCVLFCDGHMRSLEALYRYLEGLPELKNLEFSKIADGITQRLNNLQPSVPRVNAEDAKICILGKSVKSIARTHSSKMLTYREAVAMNYFFNREDDLNQAYFVPKLTPFALYWVCTRSLNFFVD